MKNKIIVIFCVWILACLMFLFYQLTGNLEFLLAYRFKKLVALCLIGFATSVSTLSFQTITHNRILTPSIMGIDSMFILIKIITIFLFGGNLMNQLDTVILFIIDSSILMISTSFLFVFLLKIFKKDLLKILLIGLILGVLYRNLTDFIARMISPEDFIIYQSTSFAQFNNINTNLLTFCAMVLPVFFALMWKKRFMLDVLSLGEQHANNLGINNTRFTSFILILIAGMVSLSTALVGPIIFLGLLVCALTYKLVDTYKHGYLLIASGLLGSILLITGQFVFERLINMEATLSVVIEFFGGLWFLYILVNDSRKKWTIR